MRQVIEVLAKIGGLGFIVAILYEGGKVIDELVDEYLENQNSDETKKN